ncbi:MAG: 50S ribosomal protein L15 [Fibrobacterota bacterium]
MYLSNLKPNKGSVKNRKRVGRGTGSGLGTTAGRGSNGQRARSGSKKRAWFEGGQMPIMRRLPKRGFYNHFKDEYQVVNLKRIEDRIDDSLEVLDIPVMRNLGLIKTAEMKVKVLGDGEISRPIKVVAHAFSKSAKTKIEKAKGKCEVI